MQKKIVFLVFLVTANIINGLCQSAGDKLFDNTTIHKIEFISESEPNLYQQLQSEVDIFFRPYHLVKMLFDGEALDSVGIRVKGNSSAEFSDQVPFKIDINEYVKGQSFNGLQKLNLGNSLDDDYRQRDRVAYELFRRSGVAAPRSAYAEVYINDVFINIYLLVEQIDKEFIEENFADLGNSLWKMGRNGEEPIYENDFSINSILSDDSEERLEKVNLENYFKFILINQIIIAADNYPDQNFYFYHSEKEDQVYFIPWDYNFSLSGSFVSDDLKLVPDGTAIFNNPEYEEFFLDIACEFSQYLFDEEYINSLVENNFSILQSNSQGAGVANPEEFKTYIHSLQSKLQLEQLPQLGASCNNFSYPYEIGDLVINEFVAKSDSLGGVQEPDGGTPDWIELYNNTNEDISLNRNYYLSDDIDFPKKWNFDSPVTIPAKGYQIIWADRDVHQQGVHSNFKIKKSGGDLILSFEDMTIIDQVSYEEQELNKGYARVPNGSGDFIIQDQTFMGNNELLSSYQTIRDNDDISIYPNPTNDVLHIKNSETILNIDVLSSVGQTVFSQEGHQSHIMLNHLPSGLYFINIQTSKNQRSLTFIKGSLP